MQLLPEKSMTVLEPFWRMRMMEVRRVGKWKGDGVYIGVEMKTCGFTFHVSLVVTLPCIAYVAHLVRHIPGLGHHYFQTYFLHFDKPTQHLFFGRFLLIY
jgi:hypothetical protein